MSVEVVNMDVHNSDPSRARDTSPTISPTGTLDCTSNRVVRLACARRRARGTKPHSRFERWRIAKFGADIDPIAAIVDEAVAAYGGRSPQRDRRLWLTVANRIGVDAFARKMDQMDGIVASYRESGTPLHSMAALFQGLLNGSTKHGKQMAVQPSSGKPEGGAE